MFPQIFRAYIEDLDLGPHTSMGPVVGTGSTISTLLHDKINPKNCQVLSLGDTGFLQFFRVVSRDYGKPRRYNGDLLQHNFHFNAKFKVVSF